MFGLMKARACALDDDAKEQRRLQYCGTCKTLGSLYGQRARLLLNHDAVFLGEVLSALEPGGGAAPDPSIASKNCLALPARDAAGTTPLAFAAAATVVLAEAKLADHAADSGKLRWRLGQRVYSRSFEEASRRLREQGFPIDAVKDALAGQAEREARAREGRFEGSAEELVASLAEPTAFATETFFAHGARVAGRPEAGEALRALGRAFGSLVYRLDALEDGEEDARTGAFNAYRAVFGGPEGLSGPDSVAIRQRIWSLGVEICGLVRSLPIPPARAELFADRLRTNLSARLGLSPKQAACSCVSALKDAKAADEAAPEPARVRVRESLALLLNLPFLASAVSGLSTPLYFSAEGGAPGAAGEAVKHAAKKAGGSKGGSDCGCCDACDCCDCGVCCDCAC